MLVLELLKWAASTPPCTSAERIASILAEGRDREFRWVMDAGLGPLLYFAVQDHFERVPAAWRDVLLSADLTAKIRHAAVIDTGNQVIDTCAELGIPLTLLKGISISDQYYPAPHLRPMGDIDVLIPAEAYNPVEHALLTRGWTRMADFAPEEGNSFHHGPPLLHAELGVWLELHTRLFTESAGAWRLSRQDGLFSPLQVARQLVASTFHGRPVQRLSNELQLLYIASSWILDMSRDKVHPSLLPPLFDAVYVLKAASGTLDRAQLVAFPDCRMALASLYAMLAYLVARGLHVCDRDLVGRLSSAQDVVGVFQRTAIYAMLDHYLIGGRYWTLPLPPPVPGRYNLRNQLQKRWLGRLPILRRPT